MNMKRMISLLLALSLLAGFACAEMSMDAAPAADLLEALPQAALEETAEPAHAPTAEPVPAETAAPEVFTELTAEPTPSPVDAASPIPTADVPDAEATDAPAAEATAEPTPSPADEPAPPETTAVPVPEPESISLPETLVIGCKETVEGALMPRLEPAGSTCSFVYSSSKPKYVQVDAASGALYGARTGSAVITVTTDSGLSASCKVTVKKAPGSVKLKAGETTLAAGQDAALSVRFNSSSAASYGIAYESSDADVAFVKDGRVFAVAPGSAKISAEAFNGKRGSVVITVLPEPESVSFTQLPEILGVGQQAQLAAAVNAGSRGEIVFSCSDESIAAVSPDGGIEALSAGRITVTATAYNGVSASAEIAVQPAPESIAFAEETVYIGAGEVLTDALRLLMDENCAGEIRFSSSAARYAKVDAETGALTAVRAGEAVITARSHNGATAKCRVIVEKAPSRVKLSLADKTMGVGQVRQLGISLNGRGSYTVSSSKPSVVTVDAGGMLRAVGEGRAKITVTTHNKRSASLTITVAPAPSEIRAAADALSLGVGEDEKLRFTVNKGSVAGLRYRSSDPAVAEVDENGRVTAIGSGTAIVTATSQNGLSASTVIEVLPGPEAIHFPGEALVLAVGERRSIAFTTSPDRVKAQYSYASSDPSILRVDEKGVLSGYSRGEAIVTVTASNGMSAGLKVQVLAYAELNDAFAIAHRGASGYAPDNSLAAFEHAAALGAEMVELDVRRTRDGKLVVFHDASMEIGGRKKDIEDLKLSEIRKANPDVCTLEEALDCLAATGMEIMIELKVSGVEKETIRCVENAGISDRTLYGSFKLGVINKIKKLMPGAQTVYIMQKTDVLEDVLEDTQDYSFDIASLKSTLLSEKVVRDLHLAGKKVVGWTLNLVGEIREAVSMGVDAVITDYPDRVSRT